jgi:uncharacterized protein GlcG (DUF336 family)
MGLRQPWRGGLALLMLAGLLAGCSGSTGDSRTGIGRGPEGCTGFCQDAPTNLTVEDVATIIAQGVHEASARNAPATIGVVDRVGNVLGIYRMAGAPETILITSGVEVVTGGPVSGGLDNVEIVPSELGVIAKALTAAYFSSEGNAFTTRTANQIIQENFNPLEFNAPGGPLFSVQISQLPCSDISQRFNGIGPGPGPHRSPIGFAADPGGLPLYKDGVLVGAVSAIADGVYTLDKVVTDRDVDVDELIATAATFGFAAPRDRRANVITVEGKTLRFSDVDFGDLLTDPEDALPFDALPPGLLAVIGYTVAMAGGPPPPLRAGTAFGQPESGVRPAAANELDPSLDAFVLVDDLNQNRFPPSAGIGGLSDIEVRRLLEKSIELANRTRSQVRRPLGSSAGIHVTIVDVNGDVLGMARTRDALIDAVDVTTQKARTALIFSSADAAMRFDNVPPAQYLAPGGALQVLGESPIDRYVTDFRDFFGLPQGLADGAVAFSTRAIGNFSRPFYPDGINGSGGRNPNPQGPLSKPPGEWSLFSTGLQLDLVYNAVVRHIAFVAGLLPTDVDQNCTGYAGLNDGFLIDGQFDEVRNGLTLFAGGFPIYRDNVLIGAIGLSGDGLEQDDFLPFVAIDEVGRELGSLNNAPVEMRADTLRAVRADLPSGARDVFLRWVICPQSPYLDDPEEQNVCDGL